MEEVLVQDPLSLQEFLMFVAYLGSVTFLMGAAVFAFLCVKKLKGRRKVLRITAYSVVRLAVSFVLAVAGLLYWPFVFDVMFGFLLLPAVASEALTITASWGLMKIKVKYI